VYYSWSFTVAPVVSDTVPPVTTALSAFPAYPGFGSVLFSATDAGSGVAHTYWKLDGGPQMEAPLVYSFASGSHTVEYWSVDKAGNVEAHKALSTFVSKSHAVPTLAADSSCLVAGCHASDNIAAIHGDAGCIDCHGSSVGPTNDCMTCHGASSPPAHHDVHQVISSVSTPACTQAGCHSAALMGIHPTCATCHESADATVVAAIAAGGAHCETCHGVQAVAHVAISTAHTVTGSCFTSTCHGTDVTKMHTNDFRGSGETPPGCAACHAAGKTPSTDCTKCHADLVTPHDYVAAHASVEASIATNSSGCASCHGHDLMHVATKNSTAPTYTVPYVPGTVAEHQGCSCHAYFEATGKKACEDCHVKPLDPTAPYPYHVGVHNALQSEIAANSAGCVSCHGSDLLTVLPASNPVTHRSEHTNCSCHAYHEAGSQMACEDCHVKPMDPTAPYPYHVGAHASLEGSISGTKSSACTACHGTNVLDVSAGSMHVAGEHKNCSCHAAGVAGSLKECVDCHKDASAPHGFVDGLTHTGSGWVAASGHNTLAEGTVGAYTKFDGTSGAPLVKDSTGATITQTWPLPTKNVFWSQAPDAIKATAPTNANTAVGWGSVITCQDCHTGLRLAGPHGASDNWGIDPNYSGDYNRAVLYAELDTVAVETTSPVVSNDFNIGGISIRTGAGELTTAGAEGSSWLQNEGAGIVTTSAMNPASGHAVICAKCHDLFNPSPGATSQWALSHGEYTFTVIDANKTGVNDWSNTPHSSHHMNRATDGTGACINCHVAIPHGWVRPRLIVFQSDPAPYNAAATVSGNGMNGVSVPATITVGVQTLNTGDTFSAHNGGFYGLPVTQSLLGATLNDTGGEAWSSSYCNACGDHRYDTTANASWK
jgi:hypothetical protein